MAERDNLAERLVAVGMPQEPALFEPMRAWTYGQLDDVAGRVGGALWALGVRPGERVAVFMPTGLEAAAALIGAMRIGAVAVPISELARANDVRAILRDASPIVAVVHRTLEPVLDEIRREAPSLLEVIAVGGARGSERDFDAVVAAAARAPVAETGADDPALIMYAAGASDLAPRGVLHTQATPRAAFEAYARGVLGLGRGDRVFSTAKLSSAYGLSTGLIFPLLAGAASVLLPTQPRSKEVLGMLAQHKPTLLFATPSQYQQLLADADPGTPIAFKGLRAAVAGGEGLPATLATRVRNRLGVDLLPVYGLTEAFHAVIAAAPGAGKPGSAGVAVPGCRVRVVDDDGGPLGPLEIGVLEVASPALAKGYWNRPAETAAAFRGEWLRTGDRCMIDESGAVFHAGRTDGIFKVGGRWVDPDEVERALLGHPAVWECAVIGIEDEHGLSKPMAFVVPNVGHTPGGELEAELVAYVKNELAPYKYPRWIDFVEALPKGPGGKLLRYKLQPHKRRRRSTIPPGGL